jgi:nitrous oxidase accessory protein NosD
VVVDKQLTITGAGASQTEIYGGGTCFDVRADYVTISGFFMGYMGTGGTLPVDGAVVVGADSVSHNHITITSNILNGCSIYLDGVWDSMISGNSFDWGAWGIYMTGYEWFGDVTCGNIQIVGNHFTGNMRAIDMYNAAGGGFIIQGNTFTGTFDCRLYLGWVGVIESVIVTQNNFMDTPMNGHARSDEFFAGVVWNQNYWNGVVGPYIPTGCVTQGDYNPALMPWP